MFPCSSDLFDFPLCCIILSTIFDLFHHICRWIQLSQLDLPWTRGLSLDMPWTTIWTILYLTGLARLDVLCHVTCVDTFLIVIIFKPLVYLSLLKSY